MIMNLLRLYINFFTTGLFSIGGGLATIPFLYDMSDRTGWFSHQDLVNMLAISESTPGAIGANMATFAGFHVASIPGALAANLGLATPGVIIMLLVAKILTQFRESPIQQNAFRGLRPASLALIAAAALSVLRMTLFQAEAGVLSFLSTPLGFLSIRALLLGIVLFILMRRFDKVHPIFFLAGSAAIGIVFSFAE